ncbi:MAG: hypothetical protein BWK77_08295 [Verrucomicrobia bacterium A1]|nr:MAG: hypothetical protein BWK77_08295 [Verrucomicrobia bacterium A1]
MYERLSSWENLLLAFRKAARGKRSRPAVAAFEHRLEDNLLAVQAELRARDYRPGGYESFYIHEPKRRLISAAPFRDRVVHHALCNLLDPLFERSFIADSYANRIGKGTHRALSRAQQFARRFRYVLPCDLRQFFPGIDHGILLETLARKIADPDVLELIRRILVGGGHVLRDEYAMIWFPGDDLFAIERPPAAMHGRLRLPRLHRLPQSPPAQASQGRALPAQTQADGGRSRHGRCALRKPARQHPRLGQPRAIRKHRRLAQSGAAEGGGQEALPCRAFGYSQRCGGRRNVERSPVMKHHADVLLVTVTKTETLAVLEAFKEHTRKMPRIRSISGKVYQDLGAVNGASVWLVCSEMGAGGLGAAQQTVTKGLAALSPGAAIMVGIAFGVNEKKQAIGDVLVSEHLRLYDLQRVGTKARKPAIVLRGDRPHASPRLLDAFKTADLDSHGVKTRFGCVLSGEKLVDNVDFRAQLLAFEPEAIGGEMEGAGLYVACHDAKTDWIVVKAICDWADGHKNRSKTWRQAIAARNAAGFVLHALRRVSLQMESPAKAGRAVGKRAVILHAGSGGLAVGDGAMAAGAGGVAIKGDVHGDIRVGNQSPRKP